MSVSDDLESCYRLEYRRLVGVVAAVTGSVALAEESVQEAFARALVRSRRERPLEHLSAWIVTVALNHARDGRRSVASERRAVHRIGSARLPSVVDRADGLVLREAIAGLSRRQRDAVVLFYLLDMKVEAVAEALSVSQGTVKTALSRARGRLVEVLHDTELEA